MHKDYQPPRRTGLPHQGDVFVANGGHLPSRLTFPSEELSSDGTYGTPPGATLADLGRCRMGSRYGNMFAPFRPGFTD